MEPRVIAEILDVIIERLPKLRRHGVTRVKFAACEFDIAEKAPKVQYVAAEPDDQHLNPLDDPTTYGRRPGSPVPGYTRNKGVDE